MSIEFATFQLTRVDPPVDEWLAQAGAIREVLQQDTGAIVTLYSGERVRVNESVTDIQGYINLLWDEAAMGRESERTEIADGITAPGAASGKARIYVDVSDGDLKVVFADGTVKTIVTDT